MRFVLNEGAMEEDEGGVVLGAYAVSFHDGMEYLRGEHTGEDNMSLAYLNPAAAI